MLQVKKAGCGKRWYKTEQRVRRAADLFCIGDECVSGQKVLQRDHPLFRDVERVGRECKYDRACMCVREGGKRCEFLEALYAFLRKEQPSVKRALPPVGCESTWAHEPQTTTVWACEKTVVMAKQPGHLTSMKNELGFCTSRLSLWQRACCSVEGLRRSTARV